MTSFSLKLPKKYQLSLVLILLTLLLLNACGAAPTSTPALPPTTAAPTAAAAPTTAAATTAAPTTVAPTTAPVVTTAVPTTTRSATPTPQPVATTARPAGTGTPRAVVAPTFAPNSTPVTLPTPSAPRPAIDLSQKADALLIDLLDVYNNTQGTEDQKLKAAREFALDIEVLFEDQDEVAIDVDVASAADVTDITNKITALGGFVDDVVDIAGDYTLLASIPLKIFVSYQNPTTKNNFLRELAGVKGVQLINLPFDYDTEGLEAMPPTLDALITLAQVSKNEGIQASGADKWHAAGFKGKGVTVGIIDSGYKFIDQLKGTYLPADFTVMDFGKKIFNEDTIETGVHGTAVTEIIYSHVPEAKIVATSIRGSDAEFDEAINYLVAQKVDFISVSMGNNSVAEDGNSPLSRKIEQVNKATGIIFFFASGNEGTEHYGGVFTPNAKGFHQYIPGVDKMAFGNPTGNPLKTRIILRWDEWLNGDVNPNAADFDLVFEDASGKVLGTIDGDQRVRPPLETSSLTLAPKTLYYVKIKLKDGTPPPSKPVRLHIFLTGGLTPQFVTAVQTVGTNADSRGAIAVGAIDPPGGTDIASYSSQGPLSDGRLKPEITAPGGVSSAAYQASGGQTFPGTSAATPQVSGLAALIKSGSPSLTGTQVVQVLLENAKAPAGVTLPNTTYGYGIADVSNIPPGAVQPKGTLAAPPTNTNPNYGLLLYPGYADLPFPQPVPNP